MKRLAKKTLGCEDCGRACYVATVPCDCGGKPVMFDSGAEMKEFASLVQRQKRGEIRDLRRQVKYPLVVNDRPVKIRSPRYKNGRECVYTCDFDYEERFQDDLGGWYWVVQESKGYHTDASRLRMAVFEAQYGIQIRMTGAQQMRKRRRAA